MKIYKMSCMFWVNHARTQNSHKRRVVAEPSMNYLADGDHGVAIFADRDDCVSYWRQGRAETLLDKPPVCKPVTGLPVFLGSDPYSDFIYAVPGSKEIVLLFHGKEDILDGWTELWCARSRNEALSVLEETIKYTVRLKDEDFEDVGITRDALRAGNIRRQLYAQDSVWIGKFWWKVQAPLDTDLRVAWILLCA